MRNEQNPPRKAQTKDDCNTGQGEAARMVKLAADFGDQLLHSPDKLECNNLLDISSIRWANSDQQLKVEASVNQ